MHTIDWIFKANAGAHFRDSVNGTFGGWVFIVFIENVFMLNLYYQIMYYMLNF